MMSREILKWIRVHWALSVLWLVMAFLMARATVRHGDDFLVFWRSARAFWDGSPVYSLERDGAMVFKYPPWILPAFLPFGLLPARGAQVAWGLIEVFSLGHVCVWISRAFRPHPGILAAVFGIFFAIWKSHGYAGQISLPLLSLGLLYFDRGLGTRATQGLQQTMIWAWSSKVFTLFAVLGSRLSLKAAVRAGLIIIPIWSLLSIPALIVSPGKTPSSLFRDWKSAANSGGTELKGLAIHSAGRDAQGFPSFVVKVFKLDPSRTDVAAGLGFLFAVLLAWAWSWGSRDLSREEQWIGWLGLTPLVQPLAWVNFFALSFPLVVVAIDRARTRGTRLSQSLAWIAAIGAAAITEKSMGSFGSSFEMVSGRSWSVFLAAGVLAVVSSSPKSSRR